MLERIRFRPVDRRAAKARLMRKSDRSQWMNIISISLIFYSARAEKRKIKTLQQTFFIDNNRD
jgi:hypothetical protein